MNWKLLLSGIVYSVILVSTNAQDRHAEVSRVLSNKGLVMAGYQGWFNCEGDGTDREDAAWGDFFLKDHT